MMMMPQSAAGARIQQHHHQHQHQGPSPQQPPTLLRLCDLRPSVSSTVNTTFIILEKGQTSRSIEATGQAVCVALVADSTAAVHLQLWGPECDAFQPSDIIRLTNGVFSYYNHNMLLRAGQKGLLEKIGHFTMTFVENPNMSKLQWIPDPSNSKMLQPIGLLHASSSHPGSHASGHSSFMNSRGHH